MPKGREYKYHTFTSVYVFMIGWYYKEQSGSLTGERFRLYEPARWAKVITATDKLWS